MFDIAVPHTQAFAISYVRVHNYLESAPALGNRHPSLRVRVCVFIWEGEDCDIGWCDEGPGKRLQLASKLTWMGCLAALEISSAALFFFVVFVFFQN